MLEILGYLLCVYLVFKGFEIYQIAYSTRNRHPDPSHKDETKKEEASKDEPEFLEDGPEQLGLVLLIISILVAVAFAYWIYNQSRGAGDSLRGLVNFR